MELTYYGHSCFLVNTGNHKILFDPFITGNPLASAINIKEIKTDFVLLSHAHGDHMMDALEIGQNNGAILISNFEICTWFDAKGWKGSIGMNHGGRAKTDFGAVRYLNAIHSSQFPDGSGGGNPGGFLVETGEKNFYYAGDTALTMDMKLIPMYSNLDFAILPVGGLFTMDYNDALIASDFIECNKIIGMHFDSFPPIKIDHAEAEKAFRAKGKELKLMKIGESITL